MKDKQFVKDRFGKNVFAPTFNSPLVVLKSPKRNDMKNIPPSVEDVFRYDRTYSGSDGDRLDAPPPTDTIEQTQPTLPFQRTTARVSPITTTTTVIDRLPDALESPIFEKTIKPSFEPKCTTPKTFPHQTTFPVIDGPFTDITALPEARASTSAFRGSRLAPLSSASPPVADLKHTASSSDLSIFRRYNSSSTYDESAPAAGSYQIHSRMMGWKLTSPERRKWLLDVLANQPEATQEVSHGARSFLERDEMFFGDNRDDAAKRILKRQTAAETTCLQ